MSGYRCKCNTFPRGCDNHGCDQRRAVVILPGTTPDEKERGAWVKLTEAEVIWLLAFLVGRCGVADRIKCKLEAARP